MTMRVVHHFQKGSAGTLFSTLYTYFDKRHRVETWTADDPWSWKVMDPLVWVNSTTWRKHTLLAIQKTSDSRFLGKTSILHMVFENNHILSIL